MVSLVLIVLVHGLVYWRAVHAVTTARRSRWWGAAVIAGLGGVVLVAQLTRGELDPAWARPWHAVGFTWFAVLLYLLVLLAFGELAAGLVRAVRGPLAPGRRRALSRSLLLGAGAVAAGTVGYGVAVARRLRVVRVPVPLARLHPDLDGYTIAVLSDLHLGPLMNAAELAEVVARVNAARPDAVAVVGDVVDGDVDDLTAAAAPLADLAAPTFFVTGNHEYYSGAQQWVEHLPRLGVRVLRNERVALRRGAGVLDLAGCDDRIAARSGEPGHGYDLAAALAGRDPDRAVVLLVHQPVLVDQAVAAGVDLQVSGHTHGGQLWPLTVVARLDQPVLAGLHRVGPTWLYVTRGIGFWGPPARVGSPPEVALLTLRTP